MGTSRNTHSRFKLHIFLGESWPERVDSSICQIGFNWVTRPIIVQGFSWSSGTTGKFKYNPTTTNGIVIWCMIQVQPCTAISNTLGWKLPPEADFDFNWLWHSDPNETEQHRLILHSWWLQATMEIWVEAQFMPNSNKTHQRSVLVLGPCWLCTLDWDHWDSDFALPQNDLPAALTVTDDCDATAVWN